MEPHLHLKEGWQCQKFRIADCLIVYLSLREVEGDGDLVPPEPRQVVVVAELALQVRDLTLGEGGALLAVPVCEE